MMTVEFDETTIFCNNNNYLHYTPNKKNKFVQICEFLAISRKEQLLLWLFYTEQSQN